MWAPCPNSIAHSRNSGGNSSTGRPTSGCLPSAFTPCRIVLTARCAASRLLGARNLWRRATSSRAGWDHLRRAFRDNSVSARFELGQPGVGFLGRDVQAGRPIVGPCSKRVLPEPLALLLAFHILLDGFAHDPVRRPATRRGEPMYTFFQCAIELQAGGRECRHREWSKVLPSSTIAQQPMSAAHLKMAGAGLVRGCAT